MSEDVSDGCISITQMMIGCVMIGVAVMTDTLLLSFIPFGLLSVLAGVVLGFYISIWLVDEVTQEGMRDIRCIFYALFIIVIAYASIVSKSGTEDYAWWAGTAFLVIISNMVWAVAWRKRKVTFGLVYNASCAISAYMIYTYANTLFVRWVAAGYGIGLLSAFAWNNRKLFWKSPVKENVDSGKLR